MATKSSTPEPKEEPKETTASEDTALPQPPAPPAPTYTDPSGIERVSVISDDPSWKPAPTEVSYPHLEKKDKDA